MQRIDGGKPRRALKEELDEEKPRKPFDPRAEVPVMPSDGSFQGSGEAFLLQLSCLQMLHLEAEERASAAVGAAYDISQDDRTSSPSQSSLTLYAIGSHFLHSHPYVCTVHQQMQSSSMQKWPVNGKFRTSLQVAVV